MTVQWGRVAAIALGVFLALWLLGGDREPDAQAVACPGYVLALGTLESAEHEAASGYFNVDRLTIMVPPDAAAIPASQLRLLRGQEVEIVVRVRKPRALKQVSR